MVRVTIVGLSKAPRRKRSESSLPCDELDGFECLLLAAGSTDRRNTF
jgi:hypothetical protein